MRVIVIE